MIRLSANTEGISRALQWALAVRGTLPRVMAQSMNWAGYDSRDYMRQRMSSYIDKPTNWTKNSTFLTPAKPNNLTMRFGFKDWASKGTPAAKYLQPQVAGGPRRHKSHERQLQRAGLIGSGQYLTPTDTFPLNLNAYGNLAGGTYTQVLSRLKALGQQGYAGNASNSARSRAKRSDSDFFIGSPGKLPRGIQARVGPKPAGTGGKGSKKGGRPMTVGLKRGFHTVFYITNSAPRYNVRFPADTIMLREFSRLWPEKFNRAAIAALSRRR